jgi:hypothetical protein
MAGKSTRRPTEARLRALLANHSISEIATKLDCHGTTVRLWGLQHGLLENHGQLRYDIPSGDALRQLSVAHTDEELAGRFGCTEQTIRAHRHSSGIYRSRVRRRYSLNESFFEKIDTEEKAYTLGFMAADGNVPINLRSVRLMLQARDVHILRDIRRVMNSDARILVIKPNSKFPHRGPYKLIYFSSQTLVADLVRHGITPRKSLTLRYPKLSRRLERHFLRGLFDGDGSIGDKSFYFLGTKDVIRGIDAAVTYHTGIRLTLSKAGSLWKATGCMRSKRVLSWLYADASIFLRRKHRRFVDYWQ